WRHSKKFPSSKHHLMTAELVRLGYYAPPSLWGQTERAGRRRKKRRKTSSAVEQRSVRGSGNGRSGNGKRTRQPGAPVSRRPHRQPQKAMGREQTVGGADRGGARADTQRGDRQGAPVRARAEEAAC